MISGVQRLRHTAPLCWSLTYFMVCSMLSMAISFKFSIFNNKVWVDIHPYYPHHLTVKCNQSSRTRSSNRHLRVLPSSSQSLQDLNLFFLFVLIKDILHCLLRQKSIRLYLPYLLSPSLTFQVLNLFSL